MIIIIICFVFWKRISNIKVHDMQIISLEDGTFGGGYCGLTDSLTTCRQGHMQHGD